MEYAARCRGFDDLFGHQREEEEHRDVVDAKRDPEGEREVALGRGVRPHQRDQRAQRQQEQVLDGELRQTWNLGSHVMTQTTPFASARVPARVHQRPARWITPESAVSPVREMASKYRSLPETSASMKL